MHVPGGFTCAVFVCSIAPPEALDEGGGRHLPSVHVLLSLLLLDLQGEAGSENARRKGKEGDATDSAEGRHDFPLPCDRDTVSIAHCAQGDHPPPQGVGKAGKVFVVILFHHVHNKGREDEHKEADVEGGDQLLSVSVDDGAKELPGAASPVHPDHTEDLEEAKTTEGGGSIDTTAEASEDDQRGTDGDDIDETEGRLHEVESADPALEPRPAASRPQADDELQAEPYHNHYLQVV